PVENLVTPDLVRRLCWSPPEDRSPEGVAAALAVLGARPWQAELAAPLLAGALDAPAPADDEAQTPDAAGS
ncbi:MAG TPA: hypothetical protein VNP37_20985, partial [Actinomycetospora sp.]|nr:hypothetical protein [Actinomycetospora sp.]